MPQLSSVLTVALATAALLAVQPGAAWPQKLELLSRLEAIAAEQQGAHHNTARRAFGIQQQAAPGPVGPGPAPGPGSQVQGPPGPGPDNFTSGGHGNQGGPDLFPHDAPPHCQQRTPFGVAIMYVDDVCTREFGKLDRIDIKNKTSAKLGFDKFCKSSCLSALNQLLADVEFRDCLPPTLAKEMEPVLSFCSKDSKGEYCAVKFAEMATGGPFNSADQCKVITNDTLCRGTTNCTWSDGDHKCEMTLTAAVLDVVCDSCVTKLAETSDDLAGLAMGCRKVDGQYCMPELQKFTLDGADSSTLERFCAATSGFRLKCVTQLLGLASQSITVQAQEEYFRCARASGANITRCVESFVNTLNGIQSTLSQIPAMCRKNAAGRICYDGAPDLFKDSCFFGVVSNTRDCNTGGCAATIQNISNTFGCCIGFMNQLFTPVAFPLSRVPGSFASSNNLPPAQSVIKVNADISRFSSCTGYSAPVPLTDACAGAAATGTLSVNLKLNHSFIASSAALKADVVRSLIEDIASNVGVHPSAVIDAALSENKNIKLNAENNTGVTFTFKLKAESQSLTDAAKAAFEAQSGEARFVLGVLKSTLTAVCPHGCVGPQGSSRLAVASDPAALTLDGSVRADPCYNRDFFGQASRVMDACEVSGNPFEEAYTTQEASNATFAKICGGPCVQGLRAIAGGKYHQCLPQQMLLMSNLVAVACTRSSKTNFLCGTVIHKFKSVDCDDHRNATSCNVGQCKWNANKSRCDTRPSQEFLASICEGECVPLYTASMAGDRGEWGTEARFIDQAVCAREGSAYCIPAIIEELNDEQFSLATVDALCSNSTKGRCFRRFQTAQSGLVIKNAEEQFFDCAERAGFDEQKVVEQCLTTYFETLLMAEKYDDIVRTMCLRKTGSNVLCLSYFDKYADNSCMVQAINGQCQASCSSQLSAAFTDMGCCSGTLQQVFGVSAHDYELVPDFSGEDEAHDLSSHKTTAAPLATLEPGFVNTTTEIEVRLSQGFLATAYQCLGDSSMKYIRRACKKVREGSPLEKVLPLGIAFDAVKNDQKKKSRLERAAQADLANKMGVSKDDITSMSLDEDKSTKITISSAGSGRGFAAQQSSTTTTSSGSKLVFTVHAQNAADTTAAGAAFEQALANNRLTLPSVTGTVAKECKNCVAAGASASSVQSSATTTSLTQQAAAANTTAVPSSAAVRPALFAMVTAALLALLLL